MTNISVRRTGPFTAENRQWLVSLHGTDYTPSVTLDVSAFSTQVVDGYIPSGTGISQLASGLWGPFDKAAASGKHGLLFGTLPVDKGDIGGGRLIHGFVDASKLPGSPVIADLKAALPNVIFA